MSFFDIFVFYKAIALDLQTQLSRGVIRKMRSENRQQIYRRVPMPKCGFNKVAVQLYLSHTLAWVLSCKLAAYFQNIFF